MKLKGIEKWRMHLPSYQGRRIRFIGLRLLITVIAASTLMILSDVLPRFIPSDPLLETLEPFLPFIGPIIVICIAFILVWSMWFRRRGLLTKNRETAYEKAILVGLPGIALVMLFVFHAFTPILSLFFTPPINQNTIFLASSLLAMIPGFESIAIYIQLVLFIFFLIIGMLTAFRAFFSFGLDYMALVYLYYPEESEVQEHEIYSVLRHPAYSGIITLAASALFLHFSFYSIFYFLIIVIMMYIHIYMVEEKELIDRFGNSYVEYRKNVPAIFIHLNKLSVYFGFLFGRE